MKLIPLTQGKFAHVDDEDYDRLSKYSWHAQKTPYTYYAVRNEENWDGKSPRKKVKLHREILGITDPNITVDHENGDGLFCVKSNLRITNHSGNNANRKPYGSLKYKGVAILKRNISKPFMAQIVHNKKKHYLGTYATIEQAALAYNEKAKELHGTFASLNEV